MYGYHGVLLAFFEAALGGVPKQILQGRWDQVCGILFQKGGGEGEVG